MPRCDPYTMKVDHDRNCYSCGGFGHLTRNYRNWRIIRQEMRLEYGDNSNITNNLNRKESLIVLN